jgi:ferredoxin-NADP reductase
VAAQEIPLGHEAKLLSRFEVAEATLAFQFGKPLGFEFRPQSSDLTLVNPPETASEGNVRTFSIASAPFEDQLMFAIRMCDTGFKRSLKTVPLGTSVKMEQAIGSFTLHKNSAKLQLQILWYLAPAKRSLPANASTASPTGLRRLLARPSDSAGTEC